MINRMLDLPYDEPAETYSSSEHLFHDLGIPPGTTSRLPEAARTRAGLAAEEIEDLGETGRRARSQAGRTRARGGPSHGRRDGGGRSAQRDGGSAGSRDQSRTEHDSRSGDAAVVADRRPRRSRTRRRTRGGVPVTEPSADQTTIPTATDATSTPSAPRRRRRRRRTTTSSEAG